MYRIAVARQPPASDIRDFMDMLGPYFITNHRWKIQIRQAAKPAPIHDPATGEELAGLLKEDIKFIDASFSALEGNQILFRLDAGAEWVIYTTRKHWVEFFEEKCEVLKKEELDVDLPEFGEFMQD